MPALLISLLRRPIIIAFLWCSTFTSISAFAKHLSKYQSIVWKVAECCVSPTLKMQLYHI
ncbi:hypothetical protein AA0117_g60 [Alternaria alternata]|uniref:Uncharacterized protein n=2 Tax=Alternaria alternata complex TaxID=187734 RepID=A0A4Q4P007_ALTAL|nr:hypothetical protein AA0115_g725 [Alternaria tenuissima]RYN84755.1 hypothetical protein AA0117_g60 [Alternaria alternata]RYO25085.1 hypothetical protein AA0121_g59 [Alternaria tenuissima]